MMWGNPAWLALAPVLAAAVLVCALVWKARRKAVVQFTGTQLLSDLTNARRVGVAPVVLLSIAALLLPLGLADPRIPTFIDRNRANVVLVIDVSGSMSATDVSPSRLSAAIDAGTEFIEGMPSNWKAGLIAFSEQPLLLQAPTDDRETVIEALTTLTAAGGTGTGDAIDMAIDVGRAGSAERVGQALAEKDNFENPSRTVVVLLSDGRPTVGQLTAEATAYRAQRLGIPVFTIAFGTDAGVITVLDGDGKSRQLQVPPDPATMQAVASITDGRYYTAISADQLNQVYDSVSGQLEREAGTIDLGPVLIFSALLLAIIGGLALAVRVTLPR